MKQVFSVVSNAEPGSSIRYNSAMISDGTTSWVTSSTHGNLRRIIRSAGKMTRFRLELSVAPGAGSTRVFTILKNGVDTTLTVTLDAADTSKEIESDVSVSDGDQISIKHAFTGSPAAAVRINHYLVFDSTNPAVSSITSTHSSLSNTSTSYLFPWGSGNDADQFYAHGLISCAGTIKSLRVISNLAPGAGKSWTFTVYKNNASTAQTTSLSGASQTDNTDSSNPISVSHGDKISIEMVPAGTPSGTVFYVAMEFESSIDGESNIFFRTTNNANQFSTEYILPSSTMPGLWDSSESVRSQMFEKCEARNLVCKIFRTLTGSTSYTMTLRDDSSNTALSVVLDSSGSEKSDTTNSVKIDQNSLVSVSSVPANSPLTMLNFSMGMTLFIDPVVPKRMLMGMGT